jgi:hypothetical protein
MFRTCTKVYAALTLDESLFSLQFSPHRSLQVKLLYRAEVFPEHVEELKSRAESMRPNARGLTQHGRPPGWQEETRQV